ncbi:phosphatase PAP2 family protein [Hymenobacter sp. B1770]|uniref:phosphatase PAP2 family protein n=1 Tax=Hymenobacter sp. B1770 TaxID=1718788 RepID=UPI003CE72F43
MTLRQLLLFTAVTVPACGLCILFLDQPLALFIRANFGWLAPFFGELTSAADAVHDVLMTHFVGIPIVFLLLGAAFVVGRYVLRRPQATLFLILLLTHEFSMVTAKVLKGVVHRLRPEVLFDAGYAGTGLWQSGPHNDSFPSTHTAIYFSLFWPLAVAFPRWQKPLLVLPMLIGLGRMVLGAHYLSDVWASIWLVVAFTFLFGLLGVPRNVPEAPVLQQGPAEEEMPVLQK